MAEGENTGSGKEQKEDLFEDLDKFFAPIQDVDWPETEEPAGRAEREPSEPSAPVSSEETRFDLPDLGAIGELDQPEGEEPVEQRETPGQAGLFLGETEAGAGTAGGDWPEEEGAAEGVEYETEPDLSLERLRASPPEYANLPGPPDDEGDEDIVAAPLDEGPLEPEEPSEEAVERAAEHFAESIRLEDEREPEPEELRSPFDFPGGEPGTEEGLLEGLEEQEPARRTVRVGVGDDLGGPSWQEPSALEVGAAEEQGGPRDVPAALLTGVVLAGLAAGSIAIGPAAFAVVAGAIVLVGLGELYAAMHRRHYQPATALGLVAGGLILGAAYLKGEGAMLSMVVLSAMATFLWFMAAPPPHRRHALGHAGATLLGIVYVPMLAGYALILLKFPDGRPLTLSVIGLTFAYDTAAFVAGYFYGSRPLAPTISPKKSWEGAISATLVVIALSIAIVASSVDELSSIGDAVGLAVVVAVFAPLGDLAESLLKRDMGLKDMSGILPGHGGILDRIDSVLFVAPAAFLFLRLILP